MLRCREKENFLLFWYGMEIKLGNHEKSNYYSCLSQIKEAG